MILRHVSGTLRRSEPDCGDDEFTISKIFREAGYMEKRGAGFITVFSFYEEMGLEKPRVFEGEHFITCIPPREKDPSGLGSDNERIVRMFYSADNISVGDVVKRLGIARAIAGCRLSGLQQAGRPVRTEKGRACTYSPVQ